MVSLKPPPIEVFEVSQIVRAGRELEKATRAVERVGRKRTRGRESAGTHDGFLRKFHNRFGKR
jgi:hypothetical protein